MKAQLIATATPQGKAYVPAKRTPNKALLNDYVDKSGYNARFSEQRKQELRTKKSMSQEQYQVVSNSFYDLLLTYSY